MLLTKLHKPRTADSIVSRTHLYKRLDEGTKKKLTLISASAGFGKTTLISDWINQRNLKAAWFSIDANDNDASDFFSYIIVALQTINKEFGQKALELLQSPSPPKPESIINLLINDLVNFETDYTLILDDFHLIANTEIHKAFTYLLEYMPQNLHLFLLTRSDPNLPIAKLRSQYQLVEIRSADLSFQASDIATLFNKRLKTKLSESDIESLRLKTEGWIAGLQLAAMSMQGYGNKSEFIEAFAGNNRYIMDYLIEEVLKLQNAEIKEFLLKTSILEQFTGDLCDSVLEKSGSQEVLEILESENMFVISLDNERNWYRYHHLFADLLQQRVQAYGKETTDRLHKNACQWYEKNTSFQLAIKHAFAIEDYDKALVLLEGSVAGMWEQGQHDLILQYGGLIPDELIYTSPEFCLYYAWILIGSGNMEKAAPYLKAAEKNTQSELAGNINADALKERLGKIAVAFTYYYSHGDFSDKTFKYCKIAREYLSEKDPLWYGAAWFSYGVTYFSIGDLQQSKAAFDKAFELAKLSGNIYFISLVVTRMAEIDQQLGYYKLAYKKCSELLDLIEQKGYAGITKTDWTYGPLYFIMGISEFMWVNLDKATEYIHIAYELSKNSNDVFQKIMVLLVSAYVAKERNEPDAQKRIHEIEELMAKSKVPPFINSMIVGWQSFLLIEDEQYDEAEHLLKSYGLNVQEDISHHDEPAYISYTRLLILRGDWEGAEFLLNKLYRKVVAAKKLERMIELNVLYASLYNQQNKKQEGIHRLVEAMKLAVDENLLSYFVYNFGHTKTLVSEILKIKKTQDLGIPEPFFNNLEQAIESSKQFWKKSTDVDLSVRELDTLKLIAKGFINQQIADQLFISLNTVKTHVKNILLKLAVDSRTKAVSKAKELGII